MGSIHRFRQIVFGGSYVAHIVSSTVVPPSEVQFYNSGADYIVEGALPSGKYLFLAETNAVKDPFRLFTLKVNGDDSELCNGFPWDSGWTFDEPSGSTSSDAWEFTTFHRSGTLALQPGAWCQLEAMLDGWSPDTYIQKLSAELEKRGLVVCFGTRSVSEEVMNVSDLLNDLDRGTRAIETMKGLSREIRADLVWEPKGSARPLYSLVDSSNPVRGHGYQVATFLHGYLDRLEPFTGLISRDGLIKRV